jgi:hypothetical protein
MFDEKFIEFLRKQIKRGVISEVFISGINNTPLCIRRTTEAFKDKKPSVKPPRFLLIDFQRDFF